MGSKFENLTVISWNAQSIRNKCIEFFDFMISNSIDIACLSETWLTVRDKIYHPEYIVYRLDRSNSTYGGVAIIVRKSIKHFLITQPTKLIECIGISVQLHSSTINISSVYFQGFSKKNNSKLNHSYFKSDIHLLTNSPTSYFICGDLNSRHSSWNCIRGNKAGNLLYECKQRFGFSIQHTTGHTHIPVSSRKSSSTLDLVITNNLNSFTQPYTDPNLSSDHISVRFEIFHEASFTNPKHSKFSYKHANWKAFREHINANLNLVAINVENISNTDHIDKCIIDFHSVLINAEKQAIPKIVPKQYCYEIPEFIKNSISIRNRYRRLWYVTRDPYIKSIINFLNRRVKTLIQDHRNSQWNNQLESISKSHCSKRFWNVYKIVRNRHAVLPVLKLDNKLIISNVDKANVLASTFNENYNLTINHPSTFDIPVDHFILN